MRHLLLIAFVALMLGSCGETSIVGSSNQGAITGQYKTIVVKNNFMYAVNNSELITFDMTNKENPVLIDKKDVGRNIENLYIAEKALFIGSQTDLHIYSIKSNGIPEKKSETAHIRFDDEITLCDPVVATDKIAYVTLSTKGIINNNFGCSSLVDVNELRVYNVQDLTNPSLIQTLQMDSPKGLSLDGNYLFVSNGDSGIVIYNVGSNGKVSFLNEMTGFSTYDLIAENNKLLVVSKDEIRQYDYSDINNIILYSTLSLR